MGTFLVLIAGSCQEKNGPDNRSKLEKIDQLYQEYKRSFPEVPDISVTDLLSAMEQQNVILVDVRSPAERSVSIIPNALPARRSLLEFLIREREELLPGSTWGAAGVARHQFDVNQWCLELGGHCRTGLEDNIKFDRDRLAVSNAELVTKIVDVAGDFDRRPATPKEAREILGLAGAGADLTALPSRTTRP